MVTTPIRGGSEIRERAGKRMAGPGRWCDQDDLRTRRYHSHNSRTCFSV